MTELNRSLAANLKAQRQRWNLSQADLAEKADLSVSYVGDLEVGAKWPSAEVLQHLADALRVPPSVLLFSPAEMDDYLAWKQRRDYVQEMSEQIFLYFEKRRD